MLQRWVNSQKVFHNRYSVGYSPRECLLNYLNKLRTRLLESKISMLTPPCSRIDILMKRGDLGFLMIAHSCMVASQNYCSLGCSEWISGPVTTFIISTHTLSIYKIEPKNLSEKLFPLFRPWRMLDSVLYKKETTWSWRLSVTTKTLKCSNS